MSTVLPSKILKLMRPEDRASLGKAGLTADEAEAAFVAKNESELQVQIKTMLNRNGIYVVRSRMDKKTTTATGVPDLLFSIPRTGKHGIPVAWEVKMPSKNPTKEQHEAMRDMAASGWLVAVVRSYDEALALYRMLASLEATP